MSNATYDQGASTRAKRMRWWKDARFGMFIHWGLYSQIGRHEWVMNREQWSLEEYEPLADTWEVKERPAREWAKLAKEAGMKYMVMTTKHHEGFCLWDTKQTDYNSVKHGPKRDLVQEFVEACREFDLKIGFYYSLMDWHHPDGSACYFDEDARRRFLDFTQGCVKELMTQYGHIDILWYDVSRPLESPELWESEKMNTMVREIQPHIIINNRSQLPEDFGTPEEHITAAEDDREWEACMTFNGSWGYMPAAPDEDWHSSREVVKMLNKVAMGSGNLLLNIGPAPDGSVPPLAYKRLEPVGKWLQTYGEAVYGEVDALSRGNLPWMAMGSWSRKSNTAYYWAQRWPGKEIRIGNLLTTIKKATLLCNGQDIPFEQNDKYVIFKDLPEKNPDEIVGITILKLECEEPLRGHNEANRRWVKEP